MMLRSTLGARGVARSIVLALVAALAVMSGRQAHAQGAATGAIEGRVRSSAGAALTGAVVRLSDGTRGVYADSLGRFRFDSVAVGRHALRALRIGYVPWSGDVEVRAGETTVVEIALVPATMVIEEVWVGFPWEIHERNGQDAPRRQGVTRAPDVADGVIYAGTKHEVVQLAGSTADFANKSARQLFARVPGLFVDEVHGAGNLVSVAPRGLDARGSREFNVRQDGVVLNSDLFGASTVYYAPPLEAVERVELARGTASVQYGTPFGGRLNYVTKAPPPDRRASFESINSVGAWGLRSTYNSVAGTVGPWSYMAYASGRWSDGYRADARSTADAEYLALRYDPLDRRFSMQARVGHSRYLARLPGPLTDAQFATDPRLATRRRNYESPNITVPSLVMAWGDSGWTRVTTTVSGVFGPRNSVQFLALPRLPDLPDVDGRYDTRQVDIDRFQSLTVETRVTHTWWWKRREQVLASGVAVTSNRTRRQQLGTGTRGDDYDLDVSAGGFRRDVTFRTENGAFYVENLFRVNANWDMTLGVRTESGRTRMTGRLANFDPPATPRQVDHQHLLLSARTTYRGKAGIEWYGGWGQSYRPYVFRDAFPIATLEYSDPGPEDARGWTAEAGARGRWGTRLAYDVTAFELRTGVRAGTAYSQSVTTWPLFRTLGESRTRGVELAGELTLWQRRAASVRAFTATSVTRAVYTSGRADGFGVFTDFTGNRVENVPAITSRNGVVLERGRHALQLLVSHVGESWADAFNRREMSPLGVVGLVPAYTVTDVNAAFAVSRHARVRVGVNNLLDRAYFTVRPQGFPGPGVWPSDGRGMQASLELTY